MEEIKMQVLAAYRGCVNKHKAISNMRKRNSTPVQEARSYLLRSNEVCIDTIASASSSTHLTPSASLFLAFKIHKLFPNFIYSLVE